ncbi:N-acetylmuramoyl-L-alanine amidase [Kitasatospora sp. NPDC057223]|uniref:peptidoglycan recognition protein family protein n=1 Tax=Kitasatospora sp. NPDC057223 TaxID=3346055 RepID=UPI003643E896
MAWFPGAERMELQPESDGQPAIVPTQLILHSIAAPWTPRRMYEYWRDSTNLESHFGLGFDGSLGQYIGTQTRADANMHANLRPDGTGAISCESASNLQHTDPWTDAQVETLIRLGVWVHQQHGIPLRICRTWNDPGFGVHRLFPEWSDGGTACPGDARVRQFHEVVFPAIVARANGGTAPASPAPTTPVQEDDVPYTPAELGSAVANALMPVYNPDGSVKGEATLYQYLGGIDLANRRADAAFASIQATLAAQAAVLKLVLDQNQHVDTAAVLAAVAAVGDQAAAAVKQTLASGINVTVTTNTTPKGN